MARRKESRSKKRRFKFSPCCVLEHDRYGGGSVMVWAGIWHGARTAAVTIRGTLNSERYKKEIVLPVVIPTVQERHVIFQDDDAISHCTGTL